MLDARDQAEAMLRASEARFRAMFTEAAIGIGIADIDGRILDVNQALQDMLGFSVEEMRQYNVRDLMHPEDAGSVWRLYDQLIAGECDHYRAEKRFHRADGEQVWTHLTLSLVRDDHGEPQYQVAMIEDVTDRHLLQNRLRYQALHDPLTGLPNRALFLERLGRVFDNRAQARCGPASATWTSTASRSSTTRSATTSATSCWSRSAAGSTTRCPARASWSRAWAATSS